MLRNILKKFFHKRPSIFLADSPHYKQYSIGRFTYGYPRILESGDKNPGKLTIGAFCSISDNVTILLSGNHRVDWITTYPFNTVLAGYDHIEGHPQTKGDVNIGNDVWIGLNATILSGVIIGDGAVIAAGSVVTKNVEPYSIVGGVPAKFIKKRFEEKTIGKLLEFRWWEKDIDWIKKNIEILMSPNISQLFSEDENLR